MISPPNSSSVIDIVVKQGDTWSLEAQENVRVGEVLSLNSTISLILILILILILVDSGQTDLSIQRPESS